MKSNWQIKKLKEVCEYFNGKTHEQCIDEEGQYIVVNSKFISTDGRIFKRTNDALLPLSQGDIAMVLSDVPNGKALAKCYFIEKDDTYSLNQRICAIRSDKFHTKFLYYQLNRNKYFLSFDNGENQTNLRLNQILSCPLYLPPIPEQKRIVKILDEVFEKTAKAKENAEKNLQNARELFESYLQSVFANPGDGWEMKTLGEIADIEYGYTDTAKIEGDYRYIRITDIDNDGFLIKENKLYIKASNESKKFLMENGDLLMVRTGATFAKVLFFEKQEESVFASYLIRIKFKLNIKNKLYWYFSKSKLYWDQAQKLSSGSAQPQFNGNALKQVTFSYPNSLSEQETIVKDLDVLIAETKKLEAIYQQKLGDLEELKKSILQKAFKGELIGVQL